MTTISASVDVDAPLGRTWELLTDWERQRDWMPMTTVEVADTTTGLGARLRARSGIGPAGFVDPMVVDVWQPPYRCEVQHLGKVVTGRGVFVVSELPGGRSRLTWHEQFASVGARRVIDLLGAPIGRAVLVVALRRLARLVADESR